MRNGEQIDDMPGCHNPLVVLAHPVLEIAVIHQEIMTPDEEDADKWFLQEHYGEEIAQIGQCFGIITGLRSLPLVLHLLVTR